MKRKILVMLLALSLVFASAIMNPIDAYAMSPESTAFSAHTHTGGRVREDGCSDNGSNHLHWYTESGTCTVCGESYSTQFSVPESHVITSIYTGNNYHSGTRHYAQYKDLCTWCGHVSYHWTSFSCPGNGHCIVPQVYNPTE